MAGGSPNAYCRALGAVRIETNPRVIRVKVQTSAIANDRNLTKAARNRAKTGLPSLAPGSYTQTGTPAASSNQRFGGLNCVNPITQLAAMDKRFSRRILD
jgi:hypothetical protein